MAAVQYHALSAGALTMMAYLAATNGVDLQSRPAEVMPCSGWWRW